MEQRTVYTIGHSNHPIEHFVELLRQHAIEAVGDVRSSPFSRHNPQFTKAALQASLRSAGIKYVFLGRELGARPGDPACYERGAVSYDKLAATDIFREGLSRVERGTADYRLALMCAERDPLDCHRTILVSRHLVARGARVLHILADGTIEAHDAAIGRLLDRLKMSTTDFFRSREDTVREAYELQGASIAYVDREPVETP